MKILILGEYTSRYWAGSATEKVQRAVLKELSKHAEVLFFNYNNKLNYIKKFFGKAKLSQSKNGLLLQCGLYSITLLKNIFISEIIHILVFRKYVMFLIPILIVFRKKVVFTIHDSLLIQNKSISLSYLIFFCLIKLSNLLFVYSKYDYNLFLQYKFNAQISLIRNGIFIPDRKSREISKNQTRFNILFAGGIDNRVKGLNFLLNSLELIKHDFHLVICGQKNNRTSINNNVLYIGELEPTKYFEILQSIDLVVVTSSYESFSLTALESLAYGVPLILTKQCGIAQYITDGKEALLVEYGDESKLSEAISKIIVNNNFRERIIQNGLKLSEKFEWHKVVTQDYISNYKKLLINGK